MDSIKKFLKDEEGLTTVEYAIAGGLVASVVVLAFTELGAAVGVNIDQLTTDVSGTP
jgi:pilus assembly protein Flp/PilA